jgi:hypothetical protein
MIRPIVFEHLSALLSAPAQYSVLLIERAVVGLLRLCLILAQKVRFLVYGCEEVLMVLHFSHPCVTKFMSHLICWLVFHQ